MKTKGITIARSLCVLLQIPFLFSLLFAALYYFNVISTSTFQILNWVIGIIGYALGGFLLGKGINKKALLHALGCMAFIGLFAYFMMENRDMMDFVELGSKIFTYLLCSVVGANLSSSS